MEQTLGKRIAANRKQMGMTQDVLAEQLGVTAQAVSKWENDQSCPDITLVPRLAQIFCITTDELLGVESREVLPARIVETTQQPQTEEKESGITWELQLDSGKRGPLGMAVWVLLTGGLLLASNFWGWEADFWDILWPAGLVVLGLFWATAASVLFRITSIFFGGYFLLCNLNLLPFVLSKELLFAVFLILFGISLLIGCLRHPRKGGIHLFNRKGRERTSTFTQQGAQFTCVTGFGEDRRTVTLPRLSYGQAQVSFGDLKLDLTGCGEFTRECQLDLSCSFGDLEVFVPRCCRVEPEAGTSFGSFEIKGSPDPEAACTLRIDASVSFGEITVKYL